MPDLNLYIWYHANPELEPEFHIWLKRVHDQLGYSGRLLRRDNEEKSTFMEVYERVNDTAMDLIEGLATKQMWYSRLQSPRRCEAFVSVFQTMEPKDSA